MDEVIVAEKPAPLFFTIQIDTIQPEFCWVIRLGNSGFKVDVMPIWTSDKSIYDRQFVWRQHFKPDGYDGILLTDYWTSSCAGRQIKYSQIYASALLHFINWWDNDANFNQGFPKDNTLIGVTNYKMDRFRRELLGEEIYISQGPQSIRSGELYPYELRLDRLIQDNKTLKRLDVLSRRCQREQYLMTDLLRLMWVI